MRVRRRLVQAALSLSFLAGLSACGQFQEAQEGADQAKRGLDRATACYEALRIARFTPNLSDPARAQAEAQAKVHEIGNLANRTLDQTLRQNLLEVQASIQRMASGEIPPEGLPAWMGDQLGKYQRITTTCSRVGG